jgi:hypothetical protein
MVLYSKFAAVCSKVEGVVPLLVHRLCFMERMVKYVGRDEKCMQNFGCKACRKRALGRLRRRWEDNFLNGSSGNRVGSCGLAVHLDD